LNAPVSGRWKPAIIGLWSDGQILYIEAFHRTALLYSTTVATEISTGSRMVSMPTSVTGRIYLPISTIRRDASSDHPNEYIEKSDRFPHL
jgi:hypothetical protein